MSTSKNNPLVSIAVATYNGDTFLAEQLNSLLAQSYKNIEIIVSDDGSIDNTVKILEWYSTHNNNFKWIKNQNPPGIKNNFENALAYCKGDFIAFSDQDDYWLPNKIERLINSIENYKAIYHDSLFVNSSLQSLNERMSKKVNCYTGYNPKPFLFFNCVSGHALLFHKSLLDKLLPFPKSRHHDWWLAFIAAQNGGIKYLDEVLVHYRQHEKSQTDYLLLKESNHNKSKKNTQNLEWFTKCASVKSKHQKFFNNWLSAYQNKANHIWSSRIFFLLVNNMNSIYFISNKNILSKFFNIVKICWRKNEI